MSERHLYLDRAIGEVRGLVTLEGRPERLLIQRADEDQRLCLGARLIARVSGVEPAMATAFLDLGGDLQAILPFKPDAKPVRGALLEIEIRGEARDGKLAVARAVGMGEGAPRLLSAPADLAETLKLFARDTVVIEGPEARNRADEAEAEALETIHPLPGGGTLAIEPTRALTAVDVDLGERKGQDAKRVTRQANLTALAEAARLLRLKGLGGIVVMDLVGRGHDGAALLAAARMAFAPDNPGVAIGPVGRFGTMELSIPRRTRPLTEQLRRADGALSDRTLAQRLVRRLETEALAQPGSRIAAICAPSVAGAANVFIPALGQRFGARFALKADSSRPREQIDVSAA